MMCNINCIHNLLFKIESGRLSCVIHFLNGRLDRLLKHLETLL